MYAYLCVVLFVSHLHGFQSEFSLRALIIEIKGTSSQRQSLIEFPRPVHEVGRGVNLQATL